MAQTTRTRNRSEPITLAELRILAELLDDDEVKVQEIIDICGSFLTVRESTIFFVHQSAQDFLLVQASDRVFPDGVDTAHRTVFLRSLMALSTTLHRDMYHLKAPGVHVDNVEPPTSNPLAALRYACVYYIDHLCDSKSKSRAIKAEDVQVVGTVSAFVEKKYSYWLQGLSLCRSMAEGVVFIARLCTLVQVRLAKTLRLSFTIAVEANIVRRCIVGTGLLSFFKMPTNSPCTIKRLSKAILFNCTYLQCYSARHKV